jgi:hypothetical protein
VANIAVALLGRLDDAARGRCVREVRAKASARQVVATSFLRRVWRNAACASAYMSQ